MNDRVPTDEQFEAAYRKEFPDSLGLSAGERAFVSFVRVARTVGVGYGWMRQAIGLLWRLEDPIGGIDDDRLVELAKRTAPVCSQCRGAEQRWGIRMYHRHEPYAPAGWAGVSAFLRWVGLESEAHAAAATRKSEHYTFKAEQLRCPKCGKTNNPKGEPS